MSEYVALVDMDGTLCDYESAVRAGLEALRSPHEPTPSVDLTSGEPEWMTARRRLITTQPGFWRSLQPIEDGLVVLDLIRQAGFEPHVLTKGPSSKPRAWMEKVEWCREHLGEETLVTITEDKGLSYGRILFDDWPAYFMRWLRWRPRGLVVALDHPWNKDVVHPNLVRYDGSNAAQIRDALQAAYDRSDGEPLRLPRVT